MTAAADLWRSGHDVGIMSSCLRLLLSMDEGCVRRVRREQSSRAERRFGDDGGAGQLGAAAAGECSGGWGNAVEGRKVWSG